MRDPLLAARGQLASLFDSVGPLQPQGDLFADGAPAHRSDQGAGATGAGGTSAGVEAHPVAVSAGLGEG